jgi:hypothetical protein
VTSFSRFLKSATGSEEDAVERALFFVAGDRALLVHAVGWMIEDDLEAGLDRNGEAGPWTEIPKEDGLWIWEGTPHYHRSITYEGIDEGGEPDYSGRGKARRPTDDEMKLIKEGPIEKLFGPPKTDKEG